MAIKGAIITKIGEVIEASTTEFVAQSYELHQPPPFGSLVKTTIGNQDIFAIVYFAATLPIEPGRKPIARGRDEASEEDIYRQHPQLAQLLYTEFRSLIVGYTQENTLYPFLPPLPARIHSFVYLCEQSEMRRFGQTLDFLSLLVKAPLSSDELVAACLRSLASHQEDSRSYLISGGKELSRLLAGEPQRLNGILRRMRP